ncbi:threonine/serine exporter family protein [Caldicellulosiruptor naganoensis]|uniref:Threonine/serine exporter family protein n=1 Tax=Caldicellulosiruptor naganoensis TaxID=29324 RepID=A0ABY7BIF6_9FIRM|nr:threonine/serine exporter family protein [Caldicellulosiruptor naganoensis]WAM32618.1 threonine/serine exporter family protein [Caldicellulosiruptor naganoensis]
MEQSIWFQLFSAFFVSFSFAILTNSPKKTLFYCGIIGMFGWLVNIIFLRLSFSPIIGVFFAALTVSKLSEIFARLLKNPVPIFLIPGIIPLVPGAGMYNTMIALIKSHFDSAIKTGIQTLLVAGSIAIALMLVTSFNWIFKVFQKEKFIK